MTKKTRERLDTMGARLSALEDSMEILEKKIEQRKAENIYLQRALDMLATKRAGA
jgi:hypothetical protein